MSILAQHPGGAVHNEACVARLLGIGKNRMKSLGNRRPQKILPAQGVYRSAELEYFTTHVTTSGKPGDRFCLLRAGEGVKPTRKAVYLVVVDSYGYLTRLVGRVDDMRNDLNDLLGLPEENVDSLTVASGFAALGIGNLPGNLSGQLIEAENSEPDMLIVRPKLGVRLPSGFGDLGQYSQKAANGLPPAPHWIFTGLPSIEAALARFSKMEGGWDHTLSSVDVLLGRGEGLVQGRREQRFYPTGPHKDWDGALESMLESNGTDPNGVHGILNRYMIRAGELYGDPRTAVIYYIETDEQGYLVKVLQRYSDWDDEQGGKTRRKFNQTMKEAHARWRPHRPTLYYAAPKPKDEEDEELSKRKPSRSYSYGTNPRNLGQYARGERRKNAERVAAVRARGLFDEPTRLVETLVDEIIARVAVQAPPLCPFCDAGMWLKKSHRGKSDGQKFWGCSLYKTNGCKGSRPA